MTRPTLLVLGLSLAASAAAAQEPATKKIDIVSVTGCLREQSPGTWMVVAATDPTPSLANSPQMKEMPATAPDGKNSYKLIGVSEFSLPGKKDHTVVVRGLFLKDSPVSRLNVTSIVEALPTCVASAPK